MTATRPHAHTHPKPSIAVWKFASCDGCQLSILDCEDELLALFGSLTIGTFTEATSATSDGPYDISLVEGSISTPEDALRIQEIRNESTTLITIGACASAGGIQALRNFANASEYAALVYATPEYLSFLDTSTPVAEHVHVDYELRGCPIDRHQLLEVIIALLAGRRPVLPQSSVCEQCKRKGLSCVLVTQSIPCLGPVTKGGCGALCPSVNRGCYGCFGPQEAANTRSLASRLARDGLTNNEIMRLLRTFNPEAPEFKEVSASYDS